MFRVFCETTELSQKQLEQVEQVVCKASELDLTFWASKKISITEIVYYLSPVINTLCSIKNFTNFSGTPSNSSSCKTASRFVLNDTVFVMRW
jgi:hypothetical protein